MMSSYPSRRFDTLTHAGTDEAGKGDYMGPLVVAGVWGNPATCQALADLGVCDSKLISSDTKTRALAKQIVTYLPPEQWAVLVIAPEAYNQRIESLKQEKKTLNHLMCEAHSAVLWKLLSGCHTNHCAEPPSSLVVDKFSQRPGALQQVFNQALKRLPSTLQHVKLLECEKAESQSTMVAAASILARASYLAALEKLSETWGGATFRSGAGSPTMQAVQALIRQHQGTHTTEALLHATVKYHFKSTLAFLQK
ncbi:MAG: ribonuclease HIII [Vampirovibrionales bacterium]